MRLYRYIFYVLLRWAWVKRREKIQDAVQIAFLTLTALVFSNFITFIWNLYLFLKIDFFISEIFGLKKVHTVLLAVIISLPQYFILIHKKKYLKIIDEFKDETKQQKQKGNIITICYVLGSLLWFFLTVYLQMMKNRGEL